jgi:hypothetical protein
MDGCHLGGHVGGIFLLPSEEQLHCPEENAYNYRQHLARGDMRFDATSMQFMFRHSKTNQLGLRVHKTVALAMPGRLLDPYDAVAKAFALCPRASATDPAFMVPT